MAVGEATALREFHLVKQKDLGKGAFGKVFLAIDSNGMKHAVKICLKPEMNSDKAFLMDYLVRELGLHLSLKHRNVVELYHGLDTPECTILDMEFCDTTLTDYVSKNFRSTKGVVPEAIVKLIARDTTNAIFYLNTKQVVHRDIKTDNVLMKLYPDGSFECKLADFGFAKKESDGLRTSLGSPVYEPPEVFASKGHVGYDNACDMWSLGIMYYVLLVGRFPFIATSRELIIASVTSERLVCYEIPKEVAVSDCCRHFVKNHLIRLPENRFRSDEALNHPFVMQTVRVMNCAAPLKGSHLVSKPLTVDVDLGDYMFKKMQASLGTKLNEPHAIKNSSFSPLLWSDVVRSIGIEDESALKDMIVVCNGGVPYVVTDPLPEFTTEKRTMPQALLISSQTGVSVAGAIKPLAIPSVSAAEIQGAEGGDKSSIECFNKYLSLCSKYLKCCGMISNEHCRLYDNYNEIMSFLENVVCFDNMSKQISVLQTEVLKKFGSFPRVAFFNPNIETPSRVISSPPDPSAIQGIRMELKRARNNAQKKVDRQDMNLTSEVSFIAAVWEKHKTMDSRYTADVTQACSSLSSLMGPFCSSTEILARLYRYIQLLKKAKNTDDVRSLFPELLPIVDCEYLSVPDDQMRLLRGGSSPSAADVSDDRAAYVKTLEEQLDLMRKKVESLGAERRRLEEDREAIARKAQETIDCLKDIIERLRDELRTHGIPDPTVDSESESDK